MRWTHQNHPKILKARGVGSLQASVLAALIAFGPCAAHAGDTIEALIGSALDAEWKLTHPNKHTSDPLLSWQYRISPPFPSSWPNTGDLVFYAYPFRLGSVSDGEQIGSPWARIDMVDWKPRVTILRREIAPLGVQGVRPLTAEEKSLPSANMMMGMLSQPRLDSNQESIRRFYCGWKERNGVIVGELASLHQAFFKDLSCGSL